MPANEPSNCSANDFRRSPSFALFQMLAHANDRQQPGGQRGLEFAIHVGVRFMKDVAPFAVAKNDIFAAAFSSMAALISPVNAPLASWYMFCASQAPLGAGHRPFAPPPNTQTAGRARHRPWEFADRFTTASASATAPARSRFIFQLPAMNFLRIADILIQGFSRRDAEDASDPDRIRESRTGERRKEFRKNLPRRRVRHSGTPGGPWRKSRARLSGRRGGLVVRWRGNAFVVLMAFEFDEEQIAPFGPGDRERFDPSQIQLRPLEKFQRIRQRAGLVRTSNMMAVLSRPVLGPACWPMTANRVELPC